jgi:ADP-ribose pyrophosphatase
VSHRFRVRERREHFQGPVFGLVTDQVEMPDGEVAARDYLRHVGAVAVVPLVTRADRRGPGEQTGGSVPEVVLVRQYRHPVGAEMWELPAGLVDRAGESLPEVAARELAEEADLRAGRLDLLVDLHPSPGVSDERIRIFLARDLTPAPTPHRRRHEEATMTASRFPLDQAVRMVFTGEITNAAAVAGLLATDRARRQGWAPLRPAGAP